MSRRTNARVPHGALSCAAGPALVLLMLTACSSSWVAGSANESGPSSTSRSTASAGATASSGSTASSGATASSSAGSSATSTGSSSIARVSCRGDSCTIALAGRETQVRVFDTTIVFGAIRDGRATLQVEQEDVTCTEGADVLAGPLTLTCTRVTDDQVEFTARPS